MGHMHPENLSKLMIKHIYAKGKVSIRELIAHAIKKGETVHCSEGEYTDEGMYAMAFEYLISYHYDSKFCYPDAYCIGIQTIEPVLNTEKDKETFNKWKTDNFSIQEEWEDHMDLKWRFTRNGRVRYLLGKIQHLTGITN